MPACNCSEARVPGGSSTLSLHDALPISREGDYFGPTLNRAARIMSAGHGGQVLLSAAAAALVMDRSEEHTSELQSPCKLVCRLLLEKKKRKCRARRFGGRSCVRCMGFAT